MSARVCCKNAEEEHSKPRSLYSKVQGLRCRICNFLVLCSEERLFRAACKQKTKAWSGEVVARSFLELQVKDIHFGLSQLSSGADRLELEWTGER